MRSTPHILVINGTKVREPVFILGAPHSGTDLLARAIKRSPGFHLTMGRPGIQRVTYAFARRPAIATRRGLGAARVLRDTYAEEWRLAAQGCTRCSAECAALAGGGGLPPSGLCAEPREVYRFADASPDLIYSADVLLDAFPDAQLLQVVRDGRDVVTDMLHDDRCLAWFRPAFDNLDEVFPNPFFGVEDSTERTRWPLAARAVKCALRWRGSVRLSARLHDQTPEEQLLTLRYEDVIAKPGDAAELLSAFLGVPVSRSALDLAAREARRARRTSSGTLTSRQLFQVEKVAGRELRRLRYRLSDAD